MEDHFYALANSLGHEILHDEQGKAAGTRRRHRGHRGLLKG
jgi:hypothetical protein